MIESVIFTAIQDIVFFALFVGIAIFFGFAFFRIYKGQPVFMKRASMATEKGIYKAMGVSPREEMTAKKYAFSVLLFSLFGLILMMAILMGQAFLFMNPEQIGGMSWHLAFNTAASFITNTNWQAYSGETQASYLSQMLCMTVQNFLSGAVGIAVLFALVRGFTRKECKTVGNFWADLTRITLFMLPVCFIGALVLVSQGVPQTMKGAVTYVSLEGETSKLYLGPAAGQIIIKQLFTNGGGFWGVNSAYPFENPTPFANLLETLSLVVIPGGLCFTFGRAVLDKKQGVVLFKAMSFIFFACLIVCTTFEYLFSQFPQGVSGIGNMEGKEVRFGIGGSSLWAVATTSVSNGSVNAMHDSFTSIGGMIPIFDDARRDRVRRRRLRVIRHDRICYPYRVYRGADGGQNAGIYRQENRRVRYENGLSCHSYACFVPAFGHGVDRSSGRGARMAHQQRRARIFRDTVRFRLDGE